MSAVITKTYQAPPVCEKEILRYAGCKEADGKILSLCNSCLEEIKDKLVYKTCYCEFPLYISGNICNFGPFSLQSKQLAKTLTGCETALVFVATIGVEIDRLIVKYGRLAPSKALLLQAIGTERVEALCNAFCDDMQREKQAFLSSRFSAGYGDLSLDVQKEIFAVLECSKRIGVYLNESMLMSPSKSVTAFVGISHSQKEKKHKCQACDKKDCTFGSKI